MNPLRARLSSVVSRAPWLPALALLAPPLALFAWLAVRLALKKNFAIDEFQYAHASWLIAKGQVPYRDFFEVHFPLTYQLLSLVWLGGGDNPQNIIRLRVGMLGFLSLTCVAVWRMCAHRGRVIALLGPLMLLACLPFMTFATEIRNDPTAFAFYAAALAALYWRELPVRGRAFLSGVFLALACWGTQKAFYYGSVFFAALVVDLLVHRKRGRGYLLADPRAFVLGAGVVAVPILVYLLATRSLDDWWRWCFGWAAAYQLRYTPFSWWNGFVEYLWDHWWHLPLVAIGVVAAVRRLARERTGPPHPDHLVVASLVSTFISVTLQQAPWPYSFVPFLGIVVVLAARGLIDLLAAARAAEPTTGISGAFTVAVAIIVLGFIFHRAHQKADLRTKEKSNAYQMGVLGDVNRLTSPEDAVYDNSGSYVSRPHAYFYFYTDASIRRHEQDMLNREVPKALEEKGAVMVFRDDRYGELPRPLQRFIAGHYQRYSGDLWFWGTRYEGVGNHTFTAVKDARYFIEPASAIEGGAITVDGAVVTQPILELKKGAHRIESRQGAPFHVLWLPRDGRMWRPTPGAAHKFSTIF